MNKYIKVFIDCFKKENYSISYHRYIIFGAIVWIIIALIVPIIDYLEG